MTEPDEDLPLEERLARVPVTRVEEAVTLDQKVVMEGYDYGLRHEAPPPKGSTRSFWHGWRNGRMKTTGVAHPTQVALARDFERKRGILR